MRETDTTTEHAEMIATKEERDWRRQVELEDRAWRAAQESKATWRFWIQLACAGILIPIVVGLLSLFK